MSLTDANWNNTIEFIPIVNGGKVIKVYDCDTITIACKIPYLSELHESNIIYRFHVRLLGIDSPEIKSKDKDEKYVAVLARDKLSNLILNKYVILKNQSTDKYGLILADVYLDKSYYKDNVLSSVFDINDDTLDINDKKIYYFNKSLNNWALDNRYAVKYDGGKKNSPDNWRNYLESHPIDVIDNQYP